MNELDSLVESATQLFAQSATPADLENAKAQFLGKSGRVTELIDTGKLFADLGQHWDQFDGFVHSIGFAPRDAIAGESGALVTPRGFFAPAPE